MKLCYFIFEGGKFVNKVELEVCSIKNFVSLSCETTFEITLSECGKMKYLYLGDLNEIKNGKWYGIDYAVLFSPYLLSDIEIEKIRRYCYSWMDERS